jgi:hypothetical protein
MTTYVRHTSREFGGTLRGRGLGDSVLSPFRGTAEDWRPLAETMAGDIPIDFIIAWIDKESGGNPCNETPDPNLREVGIGQWCSAGDCADNLTMAGSTYAAQHPSPPCVQGANTYATYGMLTPQQQTDQMQALVTYINAARSRVDDLLSAAGTIWIDNGEDYWKLVKMIHALPGAIASGLAACTAATGQPCNDWDGFSSAARGIWGTTAKGLKRINDVLANANDVGMWGATSDSTVDNIVKTFQYDSTLPLMIFGLLGLGVGAWWYGRRRKSS